MYVLQDLFNTQYILFLVTASSICNVFSENILKRRGIGKGSHDLISEDEDVPWDVFCNELKKVSTKELEITKTNIINNYGLKDLEIKAVLEAFKQSEIELGELVQPDPKLIMEYEASNSSRYFLMKFIDKSVYKLQQIIASSLRKVKGSLLLPTKWNKQILRFKIIRQQIKIASNSIQSKLCLALTVCNDRWLYSQYLVEWLRHLMSLSSGSLKTIFQVIPDLLRKNLHSIKTNTRFEKTVKSIVVSNDAKQRDILDYMDEILTTKKNSINLAPETLKKGSTLLLSMFEIIDNNYEVNEVNEDKLEDITDELVVWVEKGSGDITRVLQTIIKNMEVNINNWTIEMKNKIGFVWSQIIHL